MTQNDIIGRVSEFVLRQTGAVIQYTGEAAIGTLDDIKAGLGAAVEHLTGLRRLLQSDDPDDWPPDIERTASAFGLEYPTAARDFAEFRDGLQSAVDRELDRLAEAQAEADHLGAEAAQDTDSQDTASDGDSEGDQA